MWAWWAEVIVPGATEGGQGCTMHHPHNQSQQSAGLGYAECGIQVPQHI